MARLSDADQSRFPLPRLNSGSADRPRPCPLPRSGTAHPGPAPPWHSGVAELLLQRPDDRTRTLSRARSVHSIDEVEEHAAALKRRGTNYAPRIGILRLSREFVGRTLLSALNSPTWSGSCDGPGRIAPNGLFARNLRSAGF